MSSNAGIVKIDDSRVFYAFSPDLEPVARVKPGTILEIETRDCFSNQLISEEQLVTQIDWSAVNPATGPVYVEGVEPGDALVVKILKIDVSSEGFLVTLPGAGALPDLVKEVKVRKCYVVGDKVVFRGSVINARKMVGVVGVATREKTPTGVPGRHGGNLDTKYVTEGSTIYLPVEAEGALFGLGDLHAAMGDGEVCVTGCEVSGRVLVVLDVIKKSAPKWPVLEYGEWVFVLVSNENLEKAVREAVQVSVEAISHATGVSWHEAYMLASMATDLEISQVVDPRKTVRVKIPKTIVDVTKLLESLRSDAEAKT
ncbi:MAG: acetamidase/formamidase family protein [Zestosphaera sp.]